MDLTKNKKIVMTLDAGGTNFVFSAIQAGNNIVKPERYPSNGKDLDLCLKTIVDGFNSIKLKLPEKPAAISFAFPGPADYPRGIIGELTNLPAFSGGVALGPMLEDIFKIPVFINNDGDLFAYGEYMAGIMPWINEQLKQSGSPKQYSNLLGITLGTGFGAGIVKNGELLIGDNSNAAEIWLLRNKRHTKCFAEEGISIRAIVDYYKKHASRAFNDTITPKDIYLIAKGEIEGDQTIALNAFQEMAVILADALANAITLIDGMIILGGGLSASFDLWSDRLLEEMNGNIETYGGDKIPRLSQKVYNLQDTETLPYFLAGSKKEIKIPRSSNSIFYDPEKRIGIGLTRLGTSEAINLGAYAFALTKLNKMS